MNELQIQENHTGIILIVIGLILLLGLATDYLGRITKLPRVSLLFLFGFLLGPAAFDLLPDITQRWFPIITTVALVLVGFLLGGKLADDAISHRKSEVLLLATFISLTTVFIMIAGLYVCGVPLVVCLVFAGIATATDPATTFESIKEIGVKEKFSDILQGIVSLDDAIALVLFSILLMLAHLLDGSGDGIGLLLLHSTWEIIGAILLGLILGLPMAYLTGRIKAGEPTMVEALGLVLLCGGLAAQLQVSYLIAAVVLGYTVASRAKHHKRAFHEIEDIEWPFIILFFVLTGASVNPEMVSAAGIFTAAYILFRIIGRILGSWGGGYLLNEESRIKYWLGLCLLPQAGLATGMALLASTQFPQHSATIMSVIVLATIFYEILGPLVTRHALRQAYKKA